MSTQPTHPTEPIPPTRVVESAVDRERRNPFLRWMNHVVLPGAISFCLNGILILGAAFYTFKVAIQQDIDVGDYSASVTESLADKMKQAFQWEKTPELQTPPEQADLEKLNDFRDLTNLDAQDLAPDKGDPNDDMGQGESRLALLGTGTGAGEAGSGGMGAGMGGGGGRLGTVQTWGVTIKANKIVFVIDYSGSIVVSVDDLKRELKRAIGRLKDFQAFDVILFYGTSNQDRAVADTFAGSLQNANEDAKRKFNTWIDKKAPVGGSEPMPAIQRALAEKPEAVFFFSDGMFDEENVARVKAANHGQCRFYCFVFDELLLGDPSGLPKETDGAKRLRRISEQNGGSTKIVTSADIKGR